MNEDKTSYEESKAAGAPALSTVRALVPQGNVRRRLLKNEEGKTYLEIPLTIGVVGALLVPVAAAVGALAAVATGLTIAVERVETEESEKKAS